MCVCRPRSQCVDVYQFIGGIYPILSNLMKNVVYTGHLLDISSPVTATASSAYVSSSGLEFAPHLAVQPDTGHMWSTCFVSNKELHPWFTLEFRSVTNIFNLRLGVRSLVGGQLPKDFNLSGMDKLSVYVSNSSALKSSSKQLCGSSWNYTHTKNIVLDCGENLKGRYLHIIVPSTSPTYLMICFIVVNRENGNACNSFKNSGATVTFCKYNLCRNLTLVYLHGLRFITNRSIYIAYYIRSANGVCF